MSVIVNYFFGMPFINGFVFFVAGVILYFFPPKNINFLYGYRTKNSMKNQQNWNIAQKSSALKLMQSGILLLGVSSLKTTFQLSEKYHLVIGFVSAFLAVAFIYYFTENKIKESEK